MAMKKPKRDSVEVDLPPYTMSRKDKKVTKASRGGSTQMWDRKADGDKAKGMSFTDRVKYQDKKSGGAYTAPGKLKERPAIQQDKKTAKKAAVAKMMRKMGK